jgi:hypothetical protein
MDASAISRLRIFDFQAVFTERCSTTDCSNWSSRRRISTSRYQCNGFTRHIIIISAEFIQKIFLRPLSSQNGGALQVENHWHSSFGSRPWRWNVEKEGSVTSSTSPWQRADSVSGQQQWPWRGRSLITPHTCGIEDAGLGHTSAQNASVASHVVTSVVEIERNQ